MASSSDNHEKSFSKKVKHGRRSMAEIRRADTDPRILETIGLLRKVAGLNQVAYGRVLGLHQTAVSRIESGQQYLSAAELCITAEFFGISISSLLDGRVDYWKVAERFERQPPFPKRYLSLAHSRVRELLPVLSFLQKKEGPKPTTELLSGLGLDERFMRAPDQKIGLYCNIDLLRSSIAKGFVRKDKIKAMVAHTREREVQGVLHDLYLQQKEPLGILKTWILNSHFYESNFKYLIENCSKKALVLSVAPESHMREVPYRDHVFGDFLCQYKKEYFSELPCYIGARPFILNEKGCHFHGEERCIYELKSAG